MYYVYELIDPRNNQPFYVGKGKGRRAKTHLWEIPETRNRYKENKIESIRKNGLEPKIHYVVENIEDDNLAYEIESLLIKQYGRKGYDKGGILTNICEDARPPNHRGRTYEEIYGTERACLEKEKRLATKRKNNNFGGVKAHTRSTKDKIRDSVIKSHSQRDCSHSDSTKKKIGEANSKYVGRLNKKSKGYRLLSPDGKEYILYGKELYIFCLKNNLSQSTLKKQVQKNRSCPPKYGKTAGWKLEIIESKNTQA